MEKTEKKMARLKEENESLKQMLRQLTDEKSGESWDVRRSFMLKSQVIQLERQVALLSRALSSRAAAVASAEREIIALVAWFQDVLAREDTGPTVAVTRKDVVERIQRAHRVRSSLRKCDDSDSDLGAPLVACLKYSTAPALTCVDVCDAKAKFDLRNVAKLEQDLSGLRQRLVQLRAALDACVPRDDDDASGDFPERFLCSRAYSELSAIARTCGDRLETCCDELLTSSIIHPSAPWAVLHKPQLFSTFDPVAIRKRVFAGGNQLAAAKSAVGAMCKAHAYLMEVGRMEAAAVREQLVSCKRVNQLQMHYTNNLLKQVESAYRECESNLATLATGPVREILTAWSRMKRHQTDVTLKNFLEACAANEPRLRALLPDDETQPDRPGSAIGEFGSQLRARIERAQREAARDVDKMAAEIERFKDSNEADAVGAFNAICLSDPPS